MKCQIKIKSLQRGNLKVYIKSPRSFPSLSNHSCLWRSPSNASAGPFRLSPVSVFFIVSSSSVLLTPTPLILSSSEEDNKDDKEDDEDEKDLDHQPSVGGNRLEVFEDLHVGSLHIQLCVLDVSVDPVMKWDRMPMKKQTFYRCRWWYLNVTHNLLIPTVSFLEILFFNRAPWHFEEKMLFGLYTNIRLAWTASWLTINT